MDNTNMGTIGWSAAALEALVQLHQIAPGQGVVFVNVACNRIRVVVRATLEVVYLMMCPVDTEAVIWNSPHQTLLFFTRWLYAVHGSNWSKLKLATFIENLEHGDAWYKAAGKGGVRRRSTRRRGKAQSCVSGVGSATIHQTIIHNRIS